MKCFLQLWKGCKVKEGLSLLSGLALLALIKRNGLESVSSAGSENKSDKTYMYRMVFRSDKINRLFQDLRHKSLFILELTNPDHPIEVELFQKPLNKVAKIDITKMYTYQDESYSPSWYLVILGQYKAVLVGFCWYRLLLEDL